MNCIAHRGFAASAPENTLGAIVAAATAADAVEFDVRRCGSGEIVVIHDETVDRVTDGSGEVGTLSRAALADLNVRDSGEGVPTLAEVVAAVPEDATLHVELKESGLAADVADVLADHPGAVVVSAFDAGALAEMRMVADVPLALLAAEDLEERIDRAVDLDCVAIHPHWDRCDERVVARAHEAGLRVNAWTIQDTAGLLSARAAGVDGITVDDPQFCDR